MEDLNDLRPGTILLTKFLKPKGITAYRVAKDIGVPPNRVYDIINHERGISRETAIKLGNYFGNSAEYWLKLQFNYLLNSVERQLEQNGGVSGRKVKASKKKTKKRDG